jgi:hypothetical protein
MSRFSYFLAGAMLSAGAVGGYFLRNWLLEREAIRKLREQAKKEIETRNQRNVLILKMTVVSIISVYMTLKVSSFIRWLFKSGKSDYHHHHH